MINTVVFDIGMVLLGWHTSLDGFYEPEVGKAVWKSIFMYGDWEELDRGVIPEEEVFKRMVSHSPEYEKEIMQVLSNLEPFCRKCDYAVPWVRELKEKGYRVLFLSNFSHHLLVQVPQYMEFLKDMDGGVFSYEAKLAKPDHKIYELLFQRYDLVPENCLFIDDRQDNVEAAISCGMNAVQFKDYETTYKAVNDILSNS